MVHSFVLPPYQIHIIVFQALIPPCEGKYFAVSLRQFRDKGSDGKIIAAFGVDIRVLFGEDAVGKPEQIQDETECFCVGDAYADAFSAALFQFGGAYLFYQGAAVDKSIVGGQL